MKRATEQSGVSLIIVLGLLAVLLILAVTFARTMRTGRLTSRSFADQVRAEQLVQVGFIRAVEDIDESMRGVVYPYWTQAPDAMSSTGSSLQCNLFLGEATSFIPQALADDATTANLSSRWRDLVSPEDGRTNGRIAFLVVNCSGLIDANVACTEWASGASNANYLDISYLPDMTNLDLFFSDRTNHIRYETIEELAKLNHGVSDPVSNFFIYSYDTDRDVYFETNQIDMLGTRRMQSVLKNKCWINDPDGDWDHITNLLSEAGVSDYRTAGWNLRNYLDTNCVPNTDEFEPWLDNGGSEPVPLINEICLTNQPGTSYCFQVELFYPFVTRYPTPTQDMTLVVNITPANNSPITWTFHIDTMDFADPAKRFVYYTTPTFTISDGSFICAVSSNFPVGFVAFITNASESCLVDQAPCKDPMQFELEGSLSVNDPRCNGDYPSSNWTFSSNSTLNAMNANCEPWGPNGQGLPIFIANGPMQTIGEIGHIFTGVPWQSIDLLTTNGGYLIDTMTTRLSGQHPQGLASINTRQTDVLRAIFGSSTIGIASTDCSTNRLIEQGQEMDNLVASLPHTSNTVMNSFADYLYFMGASTWMPNGSSGNKEMKEDVFRSTFDLLTFRQNLFTIIVAAQVLGGDGQTVVAEKRAVAVVCRDSYTGKYFTRFQKFITK